MTKSLRLQRTLNCPISRAWDLWTQPEHLKNWFFPNDIKIVSSDFAPLSNKTWRTEMLGLDSGTPFPVSGTFETVTPPTTLIFTHGWEDETGAIATLTRVTITLEPVGDQTRVTLEQTGLATPESRDSHCDGWSQVLTNLESYA